MSPTFDLTCVPGLSNELDGEPDQLDEMVTTFRGNADAMITSAANLERLRLGTSEIVSKAFSKAAKKAFEVESGIRAAAYYYQQVANAVAGFSPVLRGAQAKAPGWLSQLQQAQGSLSAAEADHQRAQQYARNVDPTVQQQAKTLAANAATRHNNAQVALNDARGALRAAASTVREANDEAAAKVKAAADNAGIKDSVWDYLAKAGKILIDAVVAIAKFVWEHLDTILLVLTIVSFFIPGGAAVMGVVKGVIAALKVLSKIKFAIGMAKEGWEVVQAAKDGDWATAGKKALGIGVGIGLSLVAKKVGRHVGRTTGKAMYSLDKSGKLTSTATGRTINRVLNKIGPVVRNADGSLPKYQIARAQHRTTQVITNVAEWGTQQIVKMVSKRSLGAPANSLSQTAVDGGLGSPWPGSAYAGGGGWGGR